MFSHRHVILPQPVKFCRNQVIHGGVMTSYRFSRRRPWSRKSTCFAVCGSVKQAIAKKEETLSQLREQYEKAVKRADHLEDLLEQQRKQLLGKK